jgi:hypothetical protein
MEPELAPSLVLAHNGEVKFDIVSPIADIEPIASGTSIRAVRQLRKMYGRGRWRELKGVATVRLRNGALRKVELHWYEAHGIGKRDIKIKRYLDE